MQRVKLREICAVLGKKHSMEIIITLRLGKDKHMKKIAEDTGISYTTVQARVNEMERVGLVVSKSMVSKENGKAVRVVHAKRFKHELSPLAIKQYLETDLDHWRRQHE